MCVETISLTHHRQDVTENDRKERVFKTNLKYEDSIGVLIQGVIGGVDVNKSRTEPETGWKKLLVPTKVGQPSDFTILVQVNKYLNLFHPSFTSIK